VAERLPGLSVFFPAYNDAESLPDLLARTFAVLPRCAHAWEVIVVDDGSRDATAEVLEQLVRVHGPVLRLVRHSSNRGYGAALRSGLDAARHEFVFYTDGDGQYDPGELPQLVAAAGPGVGLVNGYKIARSDPRHRVWIGRMYNRFARAVFGVRLRDIDCDFRLIRRCLLARSPLRSVSGAVCLELVRKLELSGWSVAEVPVHHYPRLHGRSQFFRLRSLVRTLRELASLYREAAPRSR
jgi:glycosyltransferase involved in cell wall biosynthesis